MPSSGGTGGSQWGAAASSRRREMPAGEVAALADADPVGDLFGVGEVGDQLTRDAEAVGDDSGDVDGGVADPLDGRDDLEHRGHGLGLLRVPGGEHGDGPHLVHEVGHVLLELVDLLGHGVVAEVEGGVRQVDHQLGEVLGLGEHGAEVAGSGVHRGARRIRRRRLRWRR